MVGNAMSSSIVWDADSERFPPGSVVMKPNTISFTSVDKCSHYVNCPVGKLKVVDYIVSMACNMNA